MKKITAPEMLKRLENAVEVYGEDYKVERCQYFDNDGAPVCILGVALEDELKESGITLGEHEL